MKLRCALAFIFLFVAFHVRAAIIPLSDTEHVIINDLRSHYSSLMSDVSIEASDEQKYSHSVRAYYTPADTQITLQPSLREMSPFAIRFMISHELGHHLAIGRSDSEWYALVHSAKHEESEVTANLFGIVAMKKMGATKEELRTFLESWKVGPTQLEGTSDGWSKGQEIIDITLSKLDEVYDAN